MVRRPCCWRSSLQWTRVCLAAGLALTALRCSWSPTSPEAAPNILLIIVDDLRPDLGAYGHDLVRSPAIDRLAARGIRFDRAYSQYPLCNPSRVSLLTGMRPHRTGVIDNNVSYLRAIPQVQTLPSRFRDLGYYTASIGKVFHGSGRHGKVRQWVDAESWDLEHFPASTRPRGSGGPVESGSIGALHWRANSIRDDQTVDGRIAAEAIEVLVQPRDQPLFLAVGFTKPHLPFEAPKEYFDLYPPQDVDEFDRRRTDAEVFTDGVDQISRRERLELTRAYWACISFVDAQIGRILETLDREHLWRETIVLLTSDHGFHLGEHGAWLKGALTETATRVPLLIWAPGLDTEQGTSEALVEMVDLYPTMIELAGFETLSSLDGVSLVPLLEDPTRSWKKAAFSQLDLGALRGRSVRTARWRYTEWDRGRKGRELYDHRADPTETVDLSTTRRARSIMRRLRRFLRGRGWIDPSP